MQIRTRELKPKNGSQLRYFKGILFFIFTIIIFFSSITHAQEKIVDQIRDATKKINITVGSPINTEMTKKVLRVVDKIRGLSFTIRRYNELFGNDSVRATRFVDRVPDEKADDPLLKNYYNVVVVSDSANQTSLWYTFVVRKDLQEVLYYDFKKSKTGNMDDWKKIWPASEFLKVKD